MNHFENHIETIKNLQYLEVNDHLPVSLLMESSGKITTYYAPFDHINREAQIVICGITPGLQQARNALNSARDCLQQGLTHDKVLAAAKQTASFSGPMRRNLIDLLDSLQLANWLGINSCAELFSNHAHLVHYTSALRYPVFVDGKNYSGTPNMLKQPILRQQIETFLLEEVLALSNSFFIPLGSKVAQVFHHLVEQGFIRESQVLNGIPHPSGANAERIAYFLGRKPREALSNKVNPDALDQARLILSNKIAASMA